jgi:cytidine deaminase
MNRIAEQLIGHYASVLHINNFSHLSAIVSARNQTTIYSRGMNDSFRKVRSGVRYTLHAEMNAIDKLKKCKKRKQIHLIVIRVNKLGQLRNSKPCGQCLKYLAHQSKKIGIKIQSVFYSNDQAEIECQRFFKLLLEEKKFTSRFFRDQKKSSSFLVGVGGVLQ